MDWKDKIVFLKMSAIEYNDLIAFQSKSET